MTPYHPHGDVLVEGFNRTLWVMLATAIKDRPTEWEGHLVCLCITCSTSVHPNREYTPFCLQLTCSSLAHNPVAATSELPDQPPGTTLKVVDNADPNAFSSRQQQQHSPPSSRYPQQQHLAPDCYH